MNQEAVKNLPLKILPCTPDGELLPEILEKAVTAKSRIFFVNHCSNVTGKVQNLKILSEICHKYGLLIIADVSQSAGCLAVDADGWQLDGLAFTGHKSLFGIRGIGGFYLHRGISLRPMKYGGTGRNSVQLTYEDGDYEYETGTRNQPGIDSLNAGAGYILEQGIDAVEEKERCLMKALFENLEDIPGVQVYGHFTEAQGPVMSLNIQGLSPSDSAYILQNVYGITVRTGLHCAPLIHRAMGTEKQGTIRVSISYFTTEEEISAFVQAVTEISRSVK